MTQQTPQQNPSVSRFEAEVAAKNYEAACAELLNILQKLDANFGNLNDIEFEGPRQLNNMEYAIVSYFCTRMANAITTLFSDPELGINENGAIRFLTLQRWINMIFASSPLSTQTIF